MTKRWVHKTDLLEIRPAENGEMVEAGQFAKDGDMIIESRWSDDDILINKDTYERDYVEVEVPDDKGIDEMTAEEKISKIIGELCGIDASDMTTAELRIRDIVTEQKASNAEIDRAVGNTNDICG